MTVLVCGGAASGKSAYAERLLCKLSGDAPRVYLATMRPFGEEAAARIEKHRAQRAALGFETIECYVKLSAAAIPPDCAVLLEDVGNLLANELFDGAGCGEDAADAVVRAAEALGRRFLRALAAVNRRLAALADGVCEVVCGIAEYCKGEEPG